jgi:hypothetical protein
LASSFASLAEEVQEEEAAAFASLSDEGEDDDHRDVWTPDIDEPEPAATAASGTHRNAEEAVGELSPVDFEARRRTALEQMARLADRYATPFARRAATEAAVAGTEDNPAVAPKGAAAAADAEEGVG